MIKKDYQDYLNRWKMVEEFERQELKHAPFDRLVSQTISIWEISNTLGFNENDVSENRLWKTLQEIWISRHD